MIVGGEIEVDESYFGGTRKGKRGRGAGGKVPVFGLLKRGGKVYTKIIPDGSAETLVPIICEKVIPDSIVYSDYWRRYNSLDVSEFKHYRINHSKLFADKYNHINGIENFWNQAKRHLRKFNGVPKENFPLFLKECEWRFNNPNPKSQLAQLNQSVKNCLSSYLVQPLVLFIIAYLALMYTSQKRPFFETSAGGWRFPFYKATQHHGRKPADEGIPESSFLC